VKYKAKKSRVNYDTQVDVSFTTIRELLRRDLHSSAKADEEEHLSFFRDYQIDAVSKKFLYSDVKLESLNKPTFDKFLSFNNRMKETNSSFVPPLIERYSKENTAVQNYLVLARRYMSHILGEFSIAEVFREAHLSSGSSIGVKYTDTSPEAKWTFPISCTDDAMPLFRDYLSYDYLLHGRIHKLNSTTGTVPAKIVSCNASRATTVPKSSSINRLIAVEPTANMYLQLGLMTVFENRFRDLGIIIARQPFRHHKLARKGSIDGKLSTIDFSSASDCVSIELLRYLLPKEWFSIVNELRCSQMDLDGSLVDLHMISTMGNATTFQIETLVFYVLGAAIIQMDCKPKCCLPDFSSKQNYISLMSVFGDDCILPTKNAQEFIFLCESVGFLVNKEKSFIEPGPGFRESCGQDFFRGRYVRPFFIERPSSSSKQAYEAWLYNILNKVLEKYILYFGPCNYVYDKHVIRYLFRKLSTLRPHILCVPEDFPSDSGLCVHDARLTACYKVSMYKPKIQNHGTISFLYKRFVYSNQLEGNEELRYSIFLKTLRGKTHVSRDTLTRYATADAEQVAWLRPVRRKGGYVVARGSTVHWTWPYH
jgi:hypothetical protein